MPIELACQVNKESSNQGEKSAVDSLIRLFNKTFQDHNTRLIRGDNEPLYQPANDVIHYHQIVFAHGFFNSALHEVAHWCIAGIERRGQVDYGYWYCPDGRDEKQQREFEQVEIKPQAIEWAFSAACGREFAVSTDNLGGVESDRFGFASKVQQQLQCYFEEGFPIRAQRFIDECRAEYNTQTFNLSACLSVCKDLK